MGPNTMFVGVFPNSGILNPKPYIPHDCPGRYTADQEQWKAEAPTASDAGVHP